MSAALTGCGASDSVDHSADAAAADAAPPDGTAAAVEDAGNDANPSPVDAGNAGDAGADVDADDAGDFPENVYPAPHHALPSVANLGGPLLLHPKFVTITFAGDAARDATRTFVDTITTSDWWAAVAKPYGIDFATSPAHAETPDPFGSKSIAMTDVQAYVQSLVDSATAPAPDGNTAYVIFLSAATTLTMPDGIISCKQFAGIHDEVTVALEAGTQHAPVVIVPVCAGEDRMTVTSHELIEVVTDPLVQSKPALVLRNSAFAGSFYDPVAEVADFCWSTSGYALWQGQSVARSWVGSSADSGGDPCLPASPGHVYFGAAPETQMDPSPVGGTQSDGYVVVKHGESADIPITVFSQAPLPHDLTVLVGWPTQYPTSKTFDPRAVKSLSKVSTTLSKSTGHNGTRLILHVTADNDAPSVQYAVVRTILENDDYATWPFLLSVL